MEISPADVPSSPGAVDLPEVPNGLSWDKDDFAYQVTDLQSLLDPKSMVLFKRMGGTEGIARGLHTDIHKGLSGEALSDTSLQRRRDFYGINKLPAKKSKGFFTLAFEAAQDKTLVMLMISACISLVFGLIEEPESGWVEGTAILVAVMLVVFVSSANDYSKEKQFQKLNNKKTERNISVIRDGTKQQINIFDLCVGDIMILQTGDIIPGDGVLITSNDLKMDESTATGESMAISKDFVKDAFFLSNTRVLEGYGTALVVAVGPKSFNGKIMMSLQKEVEDTPLQEKLSELAETIGKLGLVAAIIIFFILIIKYFIMDALDAHDWTAEQLEQSATTRAFKAIVGYLITSITIVVVAVPEGLPLAVTMALAYSMMKMLKDQNLVRRLEACETMGGATTICSDKTGTLTLNQMTVVAGYMCDHAFGLDGHGTLDMVAKEVKDQNEAFKFLLTQSIAINTKAYRGKNERGVETFMGGNQTESALLDLICKDPNCDFEKIRDDHDLIKLLGFTSARKRMSTLVKPKFEYPLNLPVKIDGATPNVLYTKGASEIVLGRCNRMFDSKGAIVPLSDGKRKELETTITRMAACALRTLTIAFKEAPAGVPEKPEDLENDLVLLAIVGIKDPVRPEVPEAVRNCQKAGIMVRMVTGDNLITAINIAKQCNIYKDETTGIAMEGPVFRRLSEEERDRIIPRLQVLSRSSPLDKELLVGRLKAMGEVVAVTGDGTNDAPALSMAHVGFAMGITGTEVAKEAAAVILMDDNFVSIVKAVMWGRNVFDSIRKFLQFQLTVNVVAVLVAFVGSLVHPEGESPLKPVQLLWVNLIMDTLAALALATEKPTPELLDRPPNNPKESLISKLMWRNIIGQSLLQAIVMFSLLFWGFKVLKVDQYSDTHMTVFFNVFVQMQLFNEINSRRIDGGLNVFRGLHKSPVFISVLIFTITAQALIVEFGGDWTHSYGLSWEHWLVCLFLGFLSLPMGLVIHLLPIKEEPVQLVPTPTAEEEERRRQEAAKARFVGGVNKLRSQIRVVHAFRRPTRTSSFYQRELDMSM